MQVFRLIVDENDQEDINDYNTGADAEKAWRKAKMRRSVFSAMVVHLDSEQPNYKQIMLNFERH